MLLELLSRFNSINALFAFCMAYDFMKGLPGYSMTSLIVGSENCQEVM